MGSLVVKALWGLTPSKTLFGIFQYTLTHFSRILSRSHAAEVGPAEGDATGRFCGNAINGPGSHQAGLRVWDLWSAGYLGTRRNAGRRGKSSAPGKGIGVTGWIPLRSPL